MSKFYDISKKVTNELPTLKIADGLIVTVNNRKSNVLKAMAAEEKKGDKEQDNFTVMSESLALLIGRESAQKVESMDLPISEYIMLYKTIMSMAMGKEVEEKRDTP